MKRPNSALGAYYAVLLSVLVGCGEVPEPAVHDGAPLIVNVAALNLEGVGDVVWDIEVDNGLSQTIWQRRVASSRYGDGAGSASYVGTCDAGAGAAQNVVKVWVVGVYEAAVTAVGSFSSGAPTGVTGDAVAFQNPTTGGPLTQTVTCQENADTAVAFDVALMRPAQQGFFDVAVNFNNIFCSAKLDCCDDTGDGVCQTAEDLRLLFDENGARARTIVLGFACTAGPNVDVTTQLYMDDIALDCTSPNGGTDFDADVVVHPDPNAAGNLCTAGALSGCAAIGEANGADADTWLFQAALYRGAELLSNAGDARKVYWNLALGVRSTIGACVLRTRATADDADNDGDGADAGTIAAGVVYPYVTWDASLASCAEEPLSFDDAGASVKTAYTGTGDAATQFDYVYSPDLPSGSTGPQCNPACLNGGTCIAENVCACVGGYTGPTCATPPPYAAAGSARLDGATGYLTRSVTAGNQRTFTLSFWVKRETTANPGQWQELFDVADQAFDIGWNGNYQMLLDHTPGTWGKTTALYRDSTAWTHVVVAVDTTRAVASERWKIYVNGEQVTDLVTASYPAQDTDSGWNSAQTAYIGRNAPVANSWVDGYVAEMAHVEGQQLDASSFGERDADGVWRPIELAGLTWGANGWYLDFADPSDLGADASGNGNDWTVVGGVAAASDSPTRNNATLNPADMASGVALSDGMRGFSFTNYPHVVRGTVGVPGSGAGRWVYEFELATQYLGGAYFGWDDGVYPTNTGVDFYSYFNGFAYMSQGFSHGLNPGYSYTSQESAPTNVTFGVGDVAALVLDLDLRKVELFINGVSQGFLQDLPGSTISPVPADALWIPVLGEASAGSAYATGAARFAADEMTYFANYGAQALAASTLPAAPTPDGTAHLRNVTYTGNGTGQSITGVGFQPDLVIVKKRTGPTSFYWYDVLRGAGIRIVSDGTYAEASNDGVTAFGADGFTVGTETGNNQIGHSYVAWCWRGGGAGVGNTDGTISATVSANPDAGFSILTWTGTSAAGTIGHGLDSAPAFIVFKERDYAGNWAVYHRDVGATQFLRLNLSDTATTNTTFFNDTEPTDTVFSVGTNGETNYSNHHYVAYAWAEVPGYSKFGTYRGNGSADGTFVHTGFRPSLVIVKRIDSSGYWDIHDDGRSPFNPATARLHLNVLDSESTAGAADIDMLADGFKLRNTTGFENASGGRYIYAAFAEHPLGGAGSSPLTAR